MNIKSGGVKILLFNSFLRRFLILKLFIMEQILNALYILTELEKKRELTAKETSLYLYYYKTLVQNNIEIPFGVEI